MPRPACESALWISSEVFFPFDDSELEGICEFVWNFHRLKKERRKIVTGAFGVPGCHSADQFRFGVGMVVSGMVVGREVARADSMVSMQRSRYLGGASPRSRATRNSR